MNWIRRLVTPEFNQDFPMLEPIRASCNDDRSRTCFQEIMRSRPRAEQRIRIAMTSHDPELIPYRLSPYRDERFKKICYENSSPHRRFCRQGVSNEPVCIYQKPTSLHDGSGLQVLRPCLLQLLKSIRPRAISLQRTKLLSVL